MSIAAGTRLGPYEILAPIGAGGMGEVWKARDTRLDRDVAIKISKQEFSDRFAREARSIAALNHTNICHLYDVGPNYLVMEYVEGPDLCGPLDFEDALPIIQQLIDGIEAAHEKNIIHRDLKPANIKITPEGVVKILDFGLAKVMEPPPSTDGNPENSPTLTIGATQAGAILGTAAYMAPEQAKGRAADKRSDIWSFGVILYEVLTGKRLFSGETAVEILGAVLNRDADISAAPARVHRLLRWCLEKDRKQRLASISDARRLLVESGADSEPAAVPFGGTASRRSVAWIVATAVLAIIAAGTSWIAYRATRPAELKPLVRLEVDLGADVSLGSAAGTDTIISPDGTRVVFVSQGKLFTRRMDQPKAVELAGTDGAFAPFFSPDGQWVAFFSGGKLKKISVDGGAAIALCDAPVARGGSWGEDGNIIAALVSGGGALSRIPSAGGAPTAVTQLAQGEATHRWPQILPGGKAVLFTSHTSTNGFDGANIEVVSLSGDGADHRRKILQRGGTFGRYLPGSNGTGHLVYINKGTLFAVPFDPGKLEVRGTPSPVLEEVASSTSNGSAQFEFSRNGTLVYRSGGGSGLLTVAWLDGAGKTQPLLAKPGAYGRPSLSPDGQRLALEITDASGPDVWVYDWQRDILTRLTFGGLSTSPVWTPDGRYIVYLAPEGVFWTRSDGASKPQPLTQSKNRLVPFSFTPDGKRLIGSQNDPGNGFDLWTVPVESDAAGLRAGKPEPYLLTPFDEREPMFSPDGRWVAYVSNDSGTHQLYVRAFPDKGGKWQVSSGAAAYPAWARNGHELFFHTADNQMMVANYTVKGDSFVTEKPRVWSEKRLANFGAVGTKNYDLAPDGKRIVALMPVDAPEAQQSRNHVIFLENFSDELRRKVPVAK